MMKFNGKKFLEVGYHLENFSKEEEYQRSAIGRYYYAAFLMARDFYEKNLNRKLPRHESHKKLIKHFKKSKREEKIEIGKKLEKLRTSRNDADYINRDINLEDVKKSRTTSEEIIDSIEKL